MSVGSGSVVFIKGSSGNTADVTPAGELKVSATITGDISGDSIQISGQSVRISGETVISKISGETVVAKISGESVKQIIPTTINTGTEIIGTPLSGGQALPSGVAVSVTVKYNANNSGKGYLGGTGTQAPFSGKGLRLEPGDSYTVAVTNPAALQIFSTLSGDTISWIANQY